MINSSNSHAKSNLAMLELVARKLGEVNDEVVYLGGCTTALFITDPSSFDVRPTVDVDCIIEVCSPVDYNKFEGKLRKKGFKQHLNDVICRWHYEEIILDVMPTDENILGFSNVWYKKALTDIVAHQIAEDLVIKSIAAPYFLATKIEAFNDRGNDDFLASHDLEDIITGLPYFSSKIMGDVLLEAAQKNPSINFLILCGHTHSAAKYQPVDNLIVEVGWAEYSQPAMQKVIKLSPFFYGN